MIVHGRWFYDYHLDTVFNYALGGFVLIFFILGIWHSITIRKENRDE